MVKGISRQVIVVQSPDPQLFEQAIFILKDDVVEKEGITDDVLLREAKRLIGTRERKRNWLINASVWASAGACAMALVWALTSLF